MSTQKSREDLLWGFFENPAIQERGLASLPTEVLLEVFSHVDLRRAGGLNLITTSKRLYNTFIVELYKESGKQLSWYPLYIGAMEGNLLALKRCLELGAPLNQPWSPLCSKVFDFRLMSGTLALTEAIEYLEVDTVAWLLDQGADPHVDFHLGRTSWIAERPHAKGQEVVKRWRQRGVPVLGPNAQRQRAYDIRCKLIRADGGKRVYREWPLSATLAKIIPGRPLPYIEIEERGGPRIRITGCLWEVRGSSKWERLLDWHYSFTSELR